MIYAFMSENTKRYPLQTMCEVLKVARSGYYAWQRHGPSQRKQQDDRLAEQIGTIFIENRKAYGSPRITRELHKAGESPSRKRVARLMAEKGLIARPKRRYKVTTQADPSQRAAPNLLAREFTAAAPNLKWATDITYVPTAQGLLYLSVMLDLFSRRVVGWAMLPTLVADLVVLCLEMAILNRRPGGDLLIHSDRGSQYSAGDFRRMLSDYDFTQSMSRKGNCWDNAVVESFFASLKVECVYPLHFRTREHAQQEVFKYIETFYNPKRLHSTLDYVSPVEFEEQYLAMYTVHKTGQA
jgi:putative transposase